MAKIKDLIYYDNTGNKLGINCDKDFENLGSKVIDSKNYIWSMISGQGKLFISTGSNNLYTYNDGGKNIK